MAHNGSNKRDCVALALAAGASVREAARDCGVGARTVHRWLTDPAFQQRVAELRAQMLDRAVGRLAGATCQATEVLRGLLNSDDERKALSAARAILESAIKFREALELAQKVDEIRSILKAKGVLK
jgi:transposase-like protein